MIISESRTAGKLFIKADNGKMLTDGTAYWYCVDADSADGLEEVSFEEALAHESLTPEEALSILLGGVEA